MFVELRKLVPVYKSPVLGMMTRDSCSRVLSLAARKDSSASNTDCRQCHVNTSGSGHSQARAGGNIDRLLSIVTNNDNTK